MPSQDWREISRLLDDEGDCGRKGETRVSLSLTGVRAADVCCRDADRDMHAYAITRSLMLSCSFSLSLFRKGSRMSVESRSQGKESEESADEAEADFLKPLSFSLFRSLDRRFPLNSSCVACDATMQVRELSLSLV